TIEFLKRSSAGPAQPTRPIMATTNATEGPFIVLPFGQVSPHRISAAKGQDEVNEAKPCSVVSGARSNKVKIADHLGVAVGELEYVQGVRHDASWLVQPRGSEMNRAFFGSALATLLFAGQAPAQPYPSRPATFIVPYGAGGPGDNLG